jgi:type IV pilus assembly protein PilY1
VKAGALSPFTWAALSTAQQDLFKRPHITYVNANQGLTQFCSSGGSCLISTAQDSAEGENLVNFLRGERTNEGTYYRKRRHVLGDIVSSEARYVKGSLQSYNDANYDTFKTTVAAVRTGMVYVGSNDGMLHAINATNGQEAWAFIPPSVLPNLHKLADSSYMDKHQFFVDGTPEVGDICPTAPSSVCTAAQWRTILVGGLNLGGKAFYALDITDPANPAFLWEFTNANLGYSYSNPRITKLANGTWVVIVASGYGVSDGRGRLFVINAATGALIDTIDTGVGSASVDAGLARISARAPNSATNNTVEAVYGGDLLGNVWRFDVNGNIGAAGKEAHRLVTLVDGSGVAQPITARPTVASINGNPVVLVGTGRYLGLTDLTTTQTQSMYAVKDKLNTASFANPRSLGSDFVAQTLTAGTCPTDAPITICSPGQSVRTASKNPVDWDLKNGWYMDFVGTGERSASDATLALGTLAFTTLIPQTSTTTTALTCSTDATPSAKSFLYYLDYLTGSAVTGTNEVVGEFVGDGVATRPSIFRNQDGTVKGIIRLSGAAGAGTDMGGTIQQDIPTGGGSGGVPTRKSWRILNGD